MRPKNILYFLITFLNVTSLVVAASQKHLVFVSHDQKSPIIAIQGLAEEMAERDYRVSMLVAAEDKHLTTKHPKVTFIGDDVPANERGEFDSGNPLGLFQSEGSASMRMYDVAYAFLSKSENRPDLIAYDVLCPIGPALAEALGVESVGLQPHVLSLDLWSEPTGVPPLMMGLTREQRESTLFRALFIGLSNLLHILVPIAQGVYEAPVRALSGLPAQYSMCEKTRHKDEMVLVQTPWLLEYARPLYPMTQVTGAWLPRLSDDLDESLAAFVDECEAPSCEAVVLISIGTNVSWDRKRASVFVDAVKRMSHLRFVWSMRRAQQSESLDLSSLPTNLHVTHFVPQLTLLSHPKVKVFASHCGLSSALESVYHKTAILAVPQCCDQFFNAANLVERGVALSLPDPHGTTSDDLVETITQLLSDSLIQARVDHYSQILKLERGRERAGDLLEMTLLGVEEIYRDRLRDMPYWKRIGLDVLAVYGLIVFVIVSLARCCCCRRAPRSRPLASRKSKTN